MTHSDRSTSSDQPAARGSAPVRWEPAAEPADPRPPGPVVLPPAAAVPEPPVLGGGAPSAHAAAGTAPEPAATDTNQASPHRASASAAGSAEEASTGTDQAAAATPLAAVIAAPGAVPPHRPPGQPTGPEAPRPLPEPMWRIRRHRRLPRLRIGAHVASPAELDRLQLTHASFGLLIGRDQAGHPVALPLFQPEPTRVVLIGAGWATRLLVFRALAFGPRAVVSTTDPGGWLELGRRASARNDRITVRAPDDPLSTGGSGDAPLLLVSGPALTGLEPSPESAPLPAWTTALTVLPELTPPRAAHIHQAGLVLTQRLSAAEADGLAGICRLPAETSYALQVLHNDMLAVLSPHRTRYAWVHLSATELATLGPPGRR